MNKTEFREMLSKLMRESKGIVRIEAVPQILSISRQEAKKLLSRWEAQGWVTRLKRGIYLPLPLEAQSAEQWSEDPWVLATILYEPCYIGGWSASEHWGLTEQLFREVVVFTTRFQRTREKTVLGSKLKIKTIKKEKMFGTTTIWKGQLKTFVSDPSRTIVDLLEDPLVGGGFTQGVEVFKKYMSGEMKNTDKLLSYIQQYGNRAVFKRIGFLCETLFPSETKLIQVAEKRVSKGYSLLDPAGTSTGQYLRKWALRIN